MTKSEAKAETGEEDNHKNNVKDVEKTTNNEKNMRQWSQYLGAVCAAFGPATMGANASFSSQLVMDLQREEGHMRMTLEEASWIPSLYMAGTIISGPVSGWISNKFGRRPILCYMGVPVMASLLLIALATSPKMLLAGRLLAGVATGMTHSQGMVFISETASPGVRKTVGSFPSLFLSIGMFLTYSAGFIFPWRTVSLLLIAFPCIGSVSLWFLPDTPYWLVEAGKNAEAEKSLTFFRGPKFDVASELGQIIEKKNEKMNKELNLKKKGTVSLLCSLSFFLPLFCVGTLYGLCQFNGMAVITVYMADVFQRSGTTIDYKMAPMFVGLVRVISAFCGTVMIRRFPKKYLFMFSTMVIAASMSCIGGFAHLKFHYPEHADLALQMDFLPILGVASACVGMSLGVLPTLHVLLSEVFPTEIRAVAVGIVQANYGILHSVGVKAFPAFIKWFDFHGTFYVYAAINVSMAVWAGITMINVDGMNLVEVENKYDMMRVNTLKSMQSLGERTRSMATLKPSKSGSSMVTLKSTKRNSENDTNI